MLRELGVSVYLLIVRVVFAVCKLFPLKDKVTVIETIGGHSAFLYRAATELRASFQIILLKTGTARLFRAADGKPLPFREGGPVVIPFGSKNPVAFALSLYHIATARVVIVDNYVGLLAAVTFKPGVQCIQLWHAIGGFKRTGLGDKTIQHRSWRAKNRFLRVYNQFHKLVVGSEALARIHMDAFGLPYERMLKTGIPRTDLFFDKELVSTVQEKLFQENPVLRDKKVLLYAPTYRDGEFENSNLQMDFTRLQQEFGTEYVVILRLHPAVQYTVDYEQRFPGFVFNYSSYPSMNELLLVSDCLITDYSSVICEYALLGRPIIFYLYDLPEYLEQRGLWDGYESLVPGPVVYTMSELIKVIRAWNFDLKKICDFSEIWNTYSTGASSRNLIEYIQKALASASSNGYNASLSDSE